MWVLRFGCYDYFGKPFIIFKALIKALSNKGDIMRKAPPENMDDNLHECYYTEVIVIYGYIKTATAIKQ